MFDTLDPVQGADFDGDDGEWLDLESGDSIVGTLADVVEEAGEYRQRLYKIRDGSGPVKLVWGKASINRQVDAGGIEVGDTIGIRNTGKTYTNRRGDVGVEYEVRVGKAGGS